MKFPTRTVNLFLLWILFSLLAIAYIGQHPYLGLGIAIVGGIILGAMSFLYYEPELPPEPSQSEVEEVTEEEAAPGETRETSSSSKFGGQHAERCPEPVEG